MIEPPDDIVTMFRTVSSQIYVMDRDSTSIHTIALGSSHCFKDFYAKEGELNLGASSVDLCVMDKLYEYAATKLTKLRNVICFYDVFSAGYELKKTQARDKAIPYHILIGLPGGDIRSKIAARCFRSIKIEPAADYRGNSAYDWFFPPETSVIERVRGHLKNAFRNKSQLVYLDSIAERAKKRGHNLLVVLPPLRKDYRALLPPSTCLYDGIEKFSPILNLQDSPAFADCDFGDMDHCNFQGALKCSDMIRGALHARVSKEKELS